MKMTVSEQDITLFFITSPRALQPAFGKKFATNFICMRSIYIQIISAIVWISSDQDPDPRLFDVLWSFNYFHV